MAARRNRQLARTQPAAATPASSATVTVAQAYSGPLPPPSDLAEYNAIVPGMAERLLAKFEDQADHRMALEKHVIFWDVRRANGGLIAAFVFGVVVLIASVLLILNGHESAGVTAIIVEFLTYGLAFLYGSETRRRERNRKAEGS